MSRNGSGVYSLAAGNPVVTGTTISSTWANNTLSDIATALTQSIAYDGQTTPVANLPMGTYAHTNVGNATARTMYASAAQVEDGTLNYLTSVAGTNAITATAPVSLAAYVAGQTFRFIAAGANTGAVTLNLNAIGAKSVVRTDGSALNSGDIASGAAVQVFYDGTNFQLLNDANGQSETVTTLTATTKVVTPQVGSSSGSFTIQSANTTAITIDASQKVGIGTNVPGTQLGVGNATDQAQLAGGLAGATSVLYLGSPNNGSGGQTTLSYVRSTGITSLGPSTTGGALGNAFNINGAGSVGIGTSSPNTKLQVTVAPSSAADDGMRVTDGTRIIQTNITGSAYSYIGIGASETMLYSTGNPLNIVSDGQPIKFIAGNAERMRIDSSGNVGIGTSSPAFRLDVEDASSATRLLLKNTANAAGGAGVYMQVTSGASVVADNTIVSDNSGNMKFFTGTSSGAERMRIDSSGNLLVGTTSATNSTNTFYRSGGYCLTTQVNTTATPTYHIIFNNPNGAVGSISTGGVATSFNIASDKRLKKDLGVVSSTDVIDNTIIHDFEWIADGIKTKGVFAQEAYEVHPDAVTKGIDKEDGSIEMPWSVDYSKYVPDLIVKCQQLQAQINELKAQLGAK